MTDSQNERTGGNSPLILGDKEMIFGYGGYHDIDFDSMYARSAVVRQRWPWTCLVDVAANIQFYRHELDDFFQLDPPDGFLDAQVNEMYTFYETESQS